MAADRSTDRPVRWRLAGLGLLLALIAAGGFALAATDPAATERFYARGVFPWFQAALTWLSGWSPVALGESLLLLFFGGLSVRLLLGLAAWWRGRRRLANLLARAVVQLVAIAGVLFFLFVVLWGLNHAREPFGQQVGLQAAPQTRDKLVQLCRLLAERAAAKRPALAEGESFLTADWPGQVAAAYRRAGVATPVLAGPDPVVRRPLISPLLTMSYVTGIYSPFTGEANVNAEIPELLVPFVACHEVAHQRGYAREDEANFIAWWVGSRADDQRVAYSCELLALRLARWALYGESFSAGMKIDMELPPGVLADNQSIDRFWSKQDAKRSAVGKAVGKLAQATNDTYLKAAGHADGAASYGRMVDLLLAALVP